MARLHWLLLFTVLSGCATIGIYEFDKKYGSSNVENRQNQASVTVKQNVHYQEVIKPIIENRCVVCHGCYDAPCQLKMESQAGLERGANKALVYNGERLLTANISESLVNLRDINYSTLQPLREQGFFPVLNERQQSPEANTEASVFYQMLKLKQQHPLPNKPLLDDSFDIALDRKQQCPTIEEFGQYKANFPLGGMPYALPELSSTEHDSLTTWLTKGAVMPEAIPINATEKKMIAQWEFFLNNESAKQQLVSRYLFEHLYLANLYFNNDKTDKQQRYFRLVRSSTAPGEPLAIIQTRRPFDSPFVGKKTGKRIYYRLVKNNDTILAKRNMPYPFGQAKFERLNALFIQPEYQVTQLPDYQLNNASNPFKTFQSIPAKSRYQFLLDQAQFSIMNFIKGPVCRGQIALNVIEDHFWVMFLNPDNFDNYRSESFIDNNADLLQLPAATSDKRLSLLYWQQYAKRQQRYVKKKLSYIESLDLTPNQLTLDLIWSGKDSNNRHEYINDNATLTVFRHFDSASVLKGFVGQAPKTAWLITYPILERIHYLLVAGFDVYGNVSHQLKTRLYMDFLRMEAESNFISLLPKNQRKLVHEYWYRDTSDNIKDYIFSDEFYQLPETGIQYQTKKPQQELYQLVSQHTQNSSTSNQYNLAKINKKISGKDNRSIENTLALLNTMTGDKVAILPQVSVIMVSSMNTDYVYSLVNNSAHSNVAHLFSEANRRLPAEDSLSILRGVVGTYPNAFFHVKESELLEFIHVLTTMETEQDYSQLKDKFAVRRTNKGFWQYADKLHLLYKKGKYKDSGLLDFNRLENR
jgi:hypothetical protein